MYAKAAPAAQEILKKLAEAIEADRTRLRPAVRPKPEPRLGQPLGLDQVDSFSWDELLTRRHEAIFADLAKQGYKASEVLKLVLIHCESPKFEVISWMCLYYAQKEIVIKTMLELAHGLKNHLSQKRVGPAIAANRLAGEAVKTQIKELAMQYVGKVSRQKAAIAIGKVVKKAPQYVMEVLRELFPNGTESWPRPPRNKT